MDLEAFQREILIIFTNDARRALKAPTTSIKAAQTPGPDKTLAPHSVKSMGPNLTEPFDSVPLHTPIKELKVEETCEELAIGTALPSADVMHSGTYSSSKQLHSNHQIGIALTTTQTISNYSNPKKCSHNVRIQEKGDNTVRDDSRPDDTSSWEISPAEKDSSRYKSQESAGAGHVDISTLVPDYAVSKRKTVTPERLEDGIQYQPLPRSSSTHNLVQELEIDACRPEHGRLIESRYGDGQEPRKPRNSRRCGQVWDGEETRNNFLAIEILTQNIRLTWVILHYKSSSSFMVGTR